MLGIKRWRASLPETLSKECGALPIAIVAKGYNRRNCNDESSARIDQSPFLATDSKILSLIGLAYMLTHYVKSHEKVSIC
jgi:hypothetical protein